MNRTRWSLLLFAVCLALTGVLWATRGWIWLGVTPIDAERSPFSDAGAQLSTAVNCADGLGEWHGRVCFVPNIDAVPRAQTYEPWLSLHRLGVDSYADIYVCATATIALFFLAMALAFRPATWRQALLVLALLLTSAVQLAIERANFDLLIAAMLCLSGALLALRSGPAVLGGIATLSLATMLKLYTGLSCALAWRIARTDWRWTLPASLAGVAAAVMVVGANELLVLGGGAPEGGTRFSTGARWLFRHAGAPMGVAAATLAVVAALTAWRWLRKQPVPPFDRWPRRTALFQIAFLTAVPLFLLKDSYDYRLVLWLPCLTLPFAWPGSSLVARPWRRFGMLLIALFAFVAGVELPCTWLDRLAASTQSQWPATIAAALGHGKQFLAWTLASLLTLLFACTLRDGRFPFAAYRSPAKNRLSSS